METKPDLVDMYPKSPACYQILHPGADPGFITEADYGKRGA